MSLRSIKPWFKDRLETLGFHEHVDGFNTNNIGEIGMEKAFHTRIIGIEGGPIAMSDQRTIADCEVRCFFKGGTNASEAIDTAIYEIENIIKQCCNIKNRTKDGILNVIFQRAEIDPRGVGNDHSVLVTMSFDTVVLMDVDNT